MWSTVDITGGLGWTILVLTPKGNTDIRGIGLLEMIWKAMESIINTHLWSSIQFHNVLQELHTGRGTGTETTELKLSQELAIINQDPLFLAFLKLNKAYGTVDRVRIIRKLEGYGMGPQMYENISTFWVHQEVITRQNRYYALKFNTTRGGM